MKMHKTLLLLLYLCATILAPTNTHAHDIQTEFHIPTTQAEKRLHDILLRDVNDQNMFECVLGRPWCNKANDDYDELITPKLRLAITQAETHAVQQSCNGQYIPGDICGLGFRPITCAQDFPDDNAVLYRTLQQTPESAIIEYTTPLGDDLPLKAIGKYKMVIKNARWQLDGIYCEMGMGFNMK